jgi:hypothetical protein
MQFCGKPREIYWNRPAPSKQLEKTTCLGASWWRKPQPNEVVSFPGGGRGRVGVFGAGFGGARRGPGVPGALPPGPGLPELPSSPPSSRDRLHPLLKRWPEPRVFYFYPPGTRLPRGCLRGRVWGVGAVAGRKPGSRGVCGIVLVTIYRGFVWFGALRVRRYWPVVAWGVGSGGGAGGGRGCLRRGFRVRSGRGRPRGGGSGFCSASGRLRRPVFFRPPPLGAVRKKKVGAGGNLGDFGPRRGAFAGPIAPRGGAPGGFWALSVVFPVCFREDPWRARR